MWFHDAMMSGSGSNSEVAAIANHVCSTPNNRHLRLERTLPFLAISGSRGLLDQIAGAARRDGASLWKPCYEETLGEGSEVLSPAKWC